MSHPISSTAYLVASGDLRLSANQVCWPAQEAMEKQIVAAFEQRRPACGARPSL